VYVFLVLPVTVCAAACAAVQIVMGRSIPEQQLQHLGSLFSTLTAGLVAWPYIDLPFTGWHKCV
jgi:hypothetical protein